MSEYTLEPYSVHFAGEIVYAMQLLLATNVPNPSYARANRTVLKRLGHFGVIRGYGGSDAWNCAQQGIDDHRLWEDKRGGSARYLIKDRQKAVIGSASIQPSPVEEDKPNSLQLYELKHRAPPTIAAQFGWRTTLAPGTHYVSAWTHIRDISQTAAVDVYSQLVVEVRDINPEACAWTTLPEHYTDRLFGNEQRKLAASLGRIATGVYDVMESSWRMPIVQDLFVDPQRYNLSES